MMDEERFNRMMNRVSNTLDKRKGSIIYLTLSAVAEELALQDNKIDENYDQTFADTAVGNSLTLRAKERGVIRKNATAAIRKGTFNMTVPVGSRFGIETVTYVVTENLGNNESKLKCEQFGEIGNAYAGDMLPITTLPGLTTAILTDILIPGENNEDDESLRNRYDESLESEAFGGNEADYKAKTKNLQGVGGVKVYPVWNGGGTVKLVIIDSTFNRPSAELVNIIQTAIDPIVNQGQGVGIAPIGHIVTVEAVEALIINIHSNIDLVEGYVWEDVKPYIIDAINDYFLELKKTWDSYDKSSGLVVRISQIDNAILHVTGVLDVTGTTLNSGSTNIILTPVQIPVLGTVIQV